VDAAKQLTLTRESILPNDHTETLVKLKEALALNETDAKASWYARTDRAPPY
jgi:hypothetical protein